MNLLLQLLTVTALIAVMVSLRQFCGQRSSRLRVKCDAGSEGCSETECFQGCGGAMASGDAGHGPGK